jgi:acyl carrier protein
MLEGVMNIRLKLQMIIADVLGISPHKVWPGASLVVDLHATSLDFMEIVVGVEEGFHIEIHDREAAKLVFVADFESLIHRFQAEEGRKRRPLPVQHTCATADL